MAENKYIVQYSTTGRASCKLKACGEIITLGDIRIGKCTPNFFDTDGDSQMLQWHHAACWFDKQSRMRATSKKVEDEGDLGGFEDMTPEDQEWLRGLIHGGGGGGPRSPPTKKRKVMPRVASPVPAAVPAPPPTAAPTKALAGCVISFAGVAFSEPLSELKSRVQACGGRVAFNVTAKVTQVVMAADAVLPKWTWKMEQAARHKTPVVSSEWLQRSIEARVPVSEALCRASLKNPPAYPPGLSAAMFDEPAPAPSAPAPKKKVLPPSETFVGVLLYSEAEQTVPALCHNLNVPFKAGCGFYELLKREKVSEGKRLLVQLPPVGGAPAQIQCGGARCRALLRLADGDVLVEPADLQPGYRLFVNSTSLSRTVQPGQAVIIETDPDEAVASGEKVLCPPIPAGVLNVAAPDVAAAPSPANDAIAMEVSSSVPSAPPAQAPKKTEVGGSVAAAGMKECLECGSERPLSGACMVCDASKGSPTLSSVGGGKGSISDAMTSPTWDTHGSLLVMNAAQLPPSKRVAAFDMDGTIITTASGLVFPRHKDDWKLLFPEIAPKLRSLVDAGYKVVFITNQAGVGKGKETKANMQSKISAVAAACAVPIQVLAATKMDIYRKPSVKVWEAFVRLCNGGVEVDKEASFYVGDAAGRQAQWAPGKKKDFSASDRKFALNVGLPFQTPEEFFLGSRPVPFVLDGCDPSALPRAGALVEPDYPPIVAASQELVVMVGCPASGKTTFVTTHLVPSGYVHINRDTLKTKKKCLTACAAALKGGKSVVIDNTNPDPDTRAEYIALANAAGVPARAFEMATASDVASHLNKFREKLSKGATPKIPDIAYGVFRSKFRPPSTSEGFSEVKKVNFIVSLSGDEERLFNEFT